MIVDSIWEGLLSREANCVIKIVSPCKNGEKYNCISIHVLTKSDYDKVAITNGNVFKYRIRIASSAVNTDSVNFFQRFLWTCIYINFRKYVQVGGSPLIFIVSDSTRGESNERLLFPKDVQQQLGIGNIRYIYGLIKEMYSGY